eukprot:TRINITY_DN2368_c0_g1_i2.p1 TRINITY_DN2368_c0_g1~~TRINITY_DN2368_c0_g1_i2.p1  ORF type:complete len:692 (-),score=98.22 TRINITY_DN2368_c0_g1_i2:410-2485(-)
MEQDKKIVYCWGWGEFGQLATGVIKEQTTPHNSYQLQQMDTSFICCGLTHTMVIDNDGVAYTFGKGKFGRLGNGNGADENITTPYTIKTDDNVKWESGYCGGFHSALVTVDNDLYVFGKNDLGQLGLGHQNDIVLPVKCSFFDKMKVAKVVCGLNHTVVMTKNNKIYAFGANESGQCGVKECKSIVDPVEVKLGIPDNYKIVSLGTGHTHSFAIVSTDSNKRTVYAWGSNQFGKCGVNSKKNVVLPTEVEGLIDKGVSKIVGGTDHTIVSTLSGCAYSFGSGSCGQLGVGTLGNILSGSNELDIVLIKPQQIKEVLFRKRVIDVSAGSYHSCVVTNDGEIYTFGSSDKGQLGLGHKRNEYDLKLLEIKNIGGISSGGRHNIAYTFSVPKARVRTSTIIEDFRSVLNSKEFSNVDVVCGGNTYKCHTIFLHRSKAFRKKFSDTEKASIEIEEEESLLLNYILSYLYTDKIQVTEKTVDDRKLVFLLSDFAKKYRIPMYDNVIRLMELFPNDLKETMKSFINVDTYSDISFTCEEETIHAHKVILSCRAPKFHAMFSSHFAESKMSSIPLLCGAKEFKMMLEYIYTDDIEQWDPECAVNLMILSNEYGIDRLREMCEKYLFDGIEIENVAWLYEVAEMNNAQFLASYCSYFMFKHFDKVTETEAYKNLNPITLETIDESIGKPKEQRDKCSIQ